jgi:hypothetical protein
MEHYFGLDVSLKLTAICIIDRTGKIEREGVVASDPEAIATFIKLHAPHVVRIGLETGATSTWLWTELYRMGLPVICKGIKFFLPSCQRETPKSTFAWIAQRLDCSKTGEANMQGWLSKRRLPE